MRLSLKTILAYTDKLFDAECQPAIERRIVGEEASVRLVERIRSVVNDAELPVPGRRGEREEWSPNLVAAYLDHQLSEAEQAQFENICMRSDVFLAEAACVHQILSHVLGKPAQMNRDCRLRLYAIPKRQKVSHVSAPAQEQVNTEDDTQNTPHQETVPFPENSTTEQTKNAETNSKGYKKRRITVTSQGHAVSNVVSDTALHADNAEEFGETDKTDLPETDSLAQVLNQEGTADTTASHEVREQGDIRFVADAVKNGEVPAERLDFYRADDQSRFAATSLPVFDSNDKNRRLGQAFEQMKRRKRMVTMATLVLLLAFISISLLFGPKKTQQGDIANQKPDATKRFRALPDDEKNNDERITESSNLWAKYDTSPTNSPRNASPSDSALATVAHNSIYSVNEAPESVLHYMPGSPQQQQSVVANQNAPNFQQGNVASNEANHAIVTTAQHAAAQAPYSFASATEIANVAPNSPAMANAFVSGNPSGVATNHIAAEYIAFGHVGTETVIAPTGQPQNTMQHQIAGFDAGNIGTTASIGNSPQFGQQQGNATIGHGSLQRQSTPGLTMQLIDRGSAQSVDQFLNNTLPAVQPATTENENNPNRVPANMTEFGRSDQTVFVGQSRRSDMSLLSHSPALLPQYRRIEQASYITDSETSYTSLPPLIEPVWNETDSGSFVALPNLPQSENIANHVPTPDTPAPPQVLEAAQHVDASETVPLSTTQNHGFEIEPAKESVQTDHQITDPPLRLPERIAKSNVINHVSLSENRDVFETSEITDSVMLVLGTEELALVRDRPENEWSWLPVSQKLKNDIVLVPAPFQAAIRFANGIVVKTEGDTRIRILPDDANGRPGIAFDCGHLIISAPNGFSSDSPEKMPSLRVVTPVGGGVLRLADAESFVCINSENKTSVKLLRVTRPYESVTCNPGFYEANTSDNVLYCPNLMVCAAKDKTVFWQKDNHAVEWELAGTSIFPIDFEKNSPPIIVYDMSNLIVTPAVVWPSLVSYDGNIPISKLDLKNQFVTMPHTFYPTLSKTWLLK